MLNDASNAPFRILLGEVAVVHLDLHDHVPTSHNREAVHFEWFRASCVVEIEELCPEVVGSSSVDLESGGRGTHKESSGHLAVLRLLMELSVWIEPLKTTGVNHFCYNGLT